MTPSASPATDNSARDNSSSAGSDTAAADNAATAKGADAGGKVRASSGKSGAQDSSAGKRSGLAQGSSVPSGNDQLTSSGNTVYFAFDDFSLGRDDISVLNDVAVRLKKEAATKVELLGHTDERGTVNYNLALGERRGKTVESFLRSLGIAADRLEVISYGETKPADDGRNESAWARNRRVEINVMTP